MENSPLQLMSRMASVVKGKYPKTPQVEDVVDPSNEDTNSSTVSSEKSSITKKGVTESSPKRYAFSYFKDEYLKIKK